MLETRLSVRGTISLSLNYCEEHDSIVKFYQFRYIIVCIEIKTNENSRAKVHSMTLNEPLGSSHVISVNLYLLSCIEHLL